MAARGFECPHCGAEVPARARVCRECGSDADTGWLDDGEIEYRGVDLPDGWGPEHDGQKPARRYARWRTIAALVTVAAMLAWVLLRY